MTKEDKINEIVKEGEEMIGYLNFLRKDTDRLLSIRKRMWVFIFVGGIGSLLGLIMDNDIFVLVGALFVWAPFLFDIFFLSREEAHKRGQLMGIIKYGQMDEKMKKLSFEIQKIEKEEAEVIKKINEEKDRFVNSKGVA